jgi:tRNA (guanine37-N1)-methyltransferase
MRIDVFTIFPSAIYSYLEVGILRRAINEGIVDLKVHDLRIFADDPRKSVDDTPYGGGPGMVIKCEPVVLAVRQAEKTGMKRPLMITSASGNLFTQNTARQLSQREGFSLICGRYEGIDARVGEILNAQELSIGDFVLAGGELAALVIIESVLRLVPGVLGNYESVSQESFEEFLLEHPHFTKPQEFEGYKVPEVLLSGNHKAIATWRREQALLKTARYRPDLLKAANLTDSDMQFLATQGYDIDQMLKEKGKQGE